MYNHLDENNLQDSRRKISGSAQALLERSVPLLEGIRRLAALSFGGENRNDDPDFALFVAIDSETHHLPANTARPLCSPNWLEQCDRELAETEKFYGSSINSACERLIARFSSAA